MGWQASSVGGTGEGHYEGIAVRNEREEQIKEGKST